MAEDSRTLRLQRAMASMVLDGDEVALETDPSMPARQQGLSLTDLESFREQSAALLTYRELARMSLIEPLEEMFPVLKALLEEADLWEACVQAFLDARVIRSGHYRDIAPSFLGWLAGTGWGQDRWPFLLELAHAEILEVLVARFPESEPPKGLHVEPNPEDLIVLDPATQIVSYAYAVHRAHPEAPTPEVGNTHLMAFRDREGFARLKELTPATAAFLVRGQTKSLRQAAEALNIEDLAPMMSLLHSLHGEGAVAGFQTAG